MDSEAGKVTYSIVHRTEKISIKMNTPNLLGIIKIFTQSVGQF